MGVYMSIQELQLQLHYGSYIVVIYSCRGTADAGAKEKKRFCENAAGRTPKQLTSLKTKKVLRITRSHGAIVWRPISVRSSK
jgi:hypothetical protein